MLQRFLNLFSAVRGNKSGSRHAEAARRQTTVRLGVEDLEARLVMSGVPLNLIDPVSPAVLSNLQAPVSVPVNFSHEIYTGDLVPQFAWPSSTPLRVVGNQLQDPAGNNVVLRGVNIAGLESSPTGFLDDQGNSTILGSADVALNDWHANLIRVTVYPDYWLGHDESATDANGNSLGEVDPTPYRQLVDQIISKAEAHNAYVMLAAWGSDLGNPYAQPAMHDLPDASTTAFWQDAAARYANRAAVLFDPFNEPHGDQTGDGITWDQWLNGSTNGRPQINEGGTLYDSPGMQGLLSTIRSTGATNIVAPEGLSYGADLSGVSALNDPANNLLYQIHLYPAADTGADGTPSVAARDARVQAVAANHPIYVGEWGTYDDGSTNPDAQNTGAGWPTAKDWTLNMLSWLDQHQYSWTAWELGPTSGPNLVSDWNYTPTSYFGAPVMQDLAGGLVANGVLLAQAPAAAPATGAATGQVQMNAGATGPATGAATNRVQQPQVAAAFTDTQDWGTGFTGSITLTNTGTSDVNGWTLEFDFTGNITDIWDAQVVSHVGDHYVIQNADWDATLAAGQSVSFGFNADWGAVQTAPTNYVLNGTALADHLGYDVIPGQLA
jgi:hypothetical protein